MEVLIDINVLIDIIYQAYVAQISSEFYSTKILLKEVQARATISYSIYIIRKLSSNILYLSTHKPNATPHDLHIFR